ncbi:hypothetical protein Pcinc_040255 [Petrolisthes cinctipes]|uniref:Uncharacterized protein n=1 Tax=Petrolisthes cinctipes TaxID=88211 RepID=A0AAE1BMA6_PETCI|nr:hypothetical protein Pcinc_040255 [Petrolisthes cinctipes]
MKREPINLNSRGDGVVGWCEGVGIGDVGDEDICGGGRGCCGWLVVVLVMRTFVVEVEDVVVLVMRTFVVEVEDVVVLAEVMLVMTFVGKVEVVVRHEEQVHVFV